MTFHDVATPVWDAIIVGAGPAGCALALALCRRKRRVLLVDAATFPRAKVCGGCLNARALAVLAKLGLSQLPRQLGAEPVRSLKLARDGRFARVALRGGVSVSRERFDQALVEACQEAGATVLCGVRGTLGELHGESRSITLRRGTQTTSANGRVVVLAHGLQAGTVAPGSWIGAGVVLHAAPPGYDPRTISMALAEGGYVGAVHVEAGRFDLAAAFDAKLVKAHGTLGATAAHILHDAGFPAIEGLAAETWKGTPHLTRRAQAVAGERWFAVGDAAGYVEPFTGEGMAWAMTGALALAPIAAKEWGPSQAAQWRATHARLVGRRQWPCRVMAKVLHAPRLSTWLVRGLNACPRLAAPFTSLLGRGVPS